MKKVIVKIALVAAIFAYGNSVVAQEKAAPKEGTEKAQQVKPGPKMTPEQRAEQRAEQLKGKLNLTAEQMPKVKEIILNHEAAKQKAMQAAGSDNEARRAAVEKDRESYVADMGKVLTPEQLTKFKAMEEHKPKAPAPAPAIKK